MTFKLSAAGLVLAFSLLAAPAFAHQGIIHEGCPSGQVFTAGDLTISGAYTRAMLPKAKVAGGFLVIENKGLAADTLLGGQTEAAAMVQVHQMSMQGDVMKMSEVEGGLAIPPGGSVSLAPGGFHLMIVGISDPFREGECLELTLKFAKAGDVPIVLGITGTAADSPPGDGMQMDMPSDHMKMEAPTQ